ncbi:hypothetical protein FACS18949_13980 [Clostridia bacterium]|nr:hypothetical protein FACS189425_09960 [Clostridia bacterium]GHV35632.1 hypothetical protein FACS18949_13980 [Clostridia bacterium]
MDIDNRTRNDDILDALITLGCKESIRLEEAALPSQDELPDMSPEFETRMRKLMRRHYGKPKLQKFRRYASRVAAALVVIMAIGFTATISFASVRIQFFNTLIEIGDEYFGFNFAPIETATPAESVALTPGLVPEGFREVSSKTIGGTVHVQYANDEGEEINFDILPKNSGTGLQVDSEVDHSFVVFAAGIEFIVYDGQNGGHNTTLVGEDDYYLYNIYSNTVSTDELISLAESLHK